MKEKLFEWLARKTPRKLLYWMVIRAWSIVTTEKHTDKEPDKVTWLMVCNYLYEKDNKK